MSDWITTKQAAGILHVHPETLRRQLKDGKLEGMRISKTEGGHMRLNETDVWRLAAIQAERVRDLGPVSEPAAEQISETTGRQAFSVSALEAWARVAGVISILFLFFGSMALGHGNFAHSDRWHQFGAGMLGAGATVLCSILIGGFVWVAMNATGSSKRA